jgi:uncharacterized protein (TIGR02265 family)
VRLYDAAVSKTVGGDGARDLVAAGRGKLSAAAREQIAALGLPLEGKVAAAYPIEAWSACVKLIAEDMFPGVEPIEAQRRLGKLRMAVAAKRLKGRILFAVSRLLPPPKALEKFVTGLRAGATGLDTRCTVVGQDHLEVWFSDVFGVPGFFMGMLEAGARDASITIKSHDGDACTYDVQLR